MEEGVSFPDDTTTKGRAFLFYFNKLCSCLYHFFRQILSPDYQIKRNLCRFAIWILLRLFILVLLIGLSVERWLPLIGSTYISLRRETPSSLPPGLSLVDTNSTIAPYSIDVVFVHGLGAFPDTTWRNSTDENGIQWIRDLLPEDVEMARLLTYSYDSTTYNDAPQKQLEDFATDLLSAFHNTRIRSSVEEKERSIVFVCHSYGGLVVKEALVQAVQEPEKNADVLQNTRALVFLGTPHFGTAYSGYLRKVALKLDQLGPNPDIFLPLAVNSTQLVELHHQFMESFRDLDIVNFYETHKQIIFRFLITHLLFRVMIVDKASATFIGLNTTNDNTETDHSGLNKFSSREDPNYIKVVMYLNFIARKLNRLRREQEEQEDKTPHDAKQNSSQNCRAIPRYIVKPRNDPNFVDRPKLMAQIKRALHQPGLGDPQRSVALWGTAGGGKSELALRYANVNRGHYDPIMWINAQNQDSIRESFINIFQALNLDFPTHPMDDLRKAQQQGSSKIMMKQNWVVSHVLHWLAQRGPEHCGWLIILDNVSSNTVSLINQIRGVRGTVIITTIDQNIKNLVNHDVVVDVMEPQEASNLLVQAATANLPEVERNEQISRLRLSQKKEVLAIVDRIGYYAIAVNSAGAYISQNFFIRENLTRYLELFDTASYGLNLHWLSNIHTQNLTTIWEGSLELLNQSNPDAANLLTLLAILNGYSIEDRLFQEGSQFNLEWSHRARVSIVAICTLLGIAISIIFQLMCYAQDRFLPTPNLSLRLQRFFICFFYMLPILLLSLAIASILLLRKHQIAVGATVARLGKNLSWECCMLAILLCCLIHVPCLAEKVLGERAPIYIKLLPIGYVIAVVASYISAQFWEAKDDVLENHISGLLMRLDFSSSTISELSRLMNGIHQEKPVEFGITFVMYIAWRVLWVSCMVILGGLIAIAIDLLLTFLFDLLSRYVGLTSSTLSRSARIKWFLWAASSEIAKFILYFSIIVAIGLSGITYWNPFFYKKHEFTITTFDLSSILQTRPDETWGIRPYSEMIEPIARFSLLHRNTDQTYFMHPLVQWWALNRLPQYEQRAWIRLVEGLMWRIYDSSSCWDDEVCQRILVPHLTRLGGLDAKVAEGRYWYLKAILHRLYRSVRQVQQAEIKMIFG